MEAKFRTDAKNAVLERLLACLVNEGLVKAYLDVDAGSLLPGKIAATVPAKQLKYWMCVTSTTVTDEDFHFQVLRHGDFLVPLPHLPVIREVAEKPRIFRVALLDPEDIGFPVQQHQLVDGRAEYAIAEIRTVTEQLLEWSPALITSDASIEQITKEMEMSEAHQEAAYNHHRGRAVPELQQSRTASIDLEQLIVEGHAVHPMHRSRIHVPPTLPIDPWNNNLLSPEIHFFAVPRSKVTVRGEFEKLIAPLVRAASARAHVVVDSCDEIVIPVHYVQIPSVLLHFPYARHLSFTAKARAQASVRTVVVEELPTLNLKLSIAVKISSAIRTINPCVAHIGQALIKPVADMVIQDKELLEVAHELAGVVSNHPDPDIAQNLACLIRQDPEHLARSRDRGERVVVCAALTERYPSRSDDFVVNTMFHLDSAEKKELFFRSYARLFLRAFFPLVLNHGLGFEAHLQNVLARFRPSYDDGNEWELVGFTVRDSGELRVHQPTLFKTTGMELDVWDAENSTLFAVDVDKVHQFAFHTMIHCHLNRLARALMLHYNAKGWEVVKEELESLIPSDSPARSLWLENDTVDWKAFITMKLQGNYHYTKVPNLIKYRPCPL